MGNITSVTRDDNLVITYNLLNLPKEIKKSGTVVSKYAYLSDGKKVSSCDADGNGYMYFGTARFTLDNDVPTFESIPFSGGRIVKTSNGYEPQYYLTDHLGSTRAIVNKDGQTVEATFDYTPFGVQITGASLPTNSTEYRFSGKELHNIPESEIYDFGARQYFPKYAVWGSVDPLSETYYPITPYAYCANNPIRYIDPDGLIPRVYIDTNGLGHAFLTVGNDKNTVVYTYGRYGTVDSSACGSLFQNSSASLASDGEGVLIKKSGDAAVEYLNKVLKKGNFYIFEINSAQDADVIDYYTLLLSNGTRTSNKNKESIYNDPHAKVIDEYNLLSNNCVIKTIEGINSKKTVIETNVISPRALVKQLEQDSRNKNDIIKIDNPEEFLHNLLNKMKK